MIINIPYNIGDTFESKKIKGIHIYVTGDENIKKLRFYFGEHEFVTIPCDVDTVRTIERR